ncbi:MAG: sugar ABC transporter permease [Clostridia bacterium]|nr:sugar ABC transporter permease [Clostridia bacterium]
MEKYYRKWFWLLIMPSMLLFFFVIAIPFIVGTLYSFTSWRGTYFAGGSFLNSFVGFGNYIKAFSDERFIHSLVYTSLYTLAAVVAINLVALAFSLMLNNIKKGVGIYRTIFFLPNMLGGLAMGFVWQFIFQVVYTEILFSPDGLFHAEFLRYMTQNTTKALFALVIMTVWQSAGYMMLIYISGLNSIPGDLYEAAQIDGAGPVRRFFKVTLPLLMPSVTIVLFLTLANSFKLLDQNVALTNGNFNTRLIALQILRTVQDNTPPDYGTAQAQAVIFFVIVAVISLFQVSVTRRKEVEY